MRLLEADRSGCVAGRVFDRIAIISSVWHERNVIISVSIQIAYAAVTYQACADRFGHIRSEVNRAGGRCVFKIGEAIGYGYNQIQFSVIVQVS